MLFTITVLLFSFYTNVKKNCEICVSHVTRNRLAGSKPPSYREVGGATQNLTDKCNLTSNVRPK